MTVTTEQKENCVIDMHITLPADRFEQEWKRIAGEYQKLARIPGFRKGKATLAAVEQKYSKEIQQEVIEKLTQAGVREAVEEKKVELALYPQVKESKLNDDRTLHITAVLTTRPEVELLKYQDLEVSIEKHMADDAAIDRELTKMSESNADFVTVEDRGLKMEDFAILDYSGMLDGTSLAERYPDLSPSFTARQHAWFRMEEKSPLPGFAEALVGMKPNESREVQVTFSKTCVEEVLREVTVTYSVKLHEIKMRQFAAIDDAFANKLRPGLTLETLREEIRQYMQQMMDHQFRQKTQTAIIEQLVKQNPCEPPMAMVQRETVNIVQNVIQENQQRGVPEEMIKSHQEELMTSAKQSAEEKVRLHFILHEIAKKEKIEITSDEFQQELKRLAERYRMTFEKLVKELQKKNAFGHIQEDLLFNKTLQWLADHAKVTELPPTSPSHEDCDEEGHVHGPHCHH